VPNWLPAYLIHGDDHGKIAERRARLRDVAEQQSGSGGVEVFEGDQADPEIVAAALSAMTMAMGRRFLVVEGVERWKESEVEPIARALKDPPPETTIAFFAREEGRAKAPKALHDAVTKAGGKVDVEQNVRAWELPKWVANEARRMGLTLEQGAAKALVTQVGDRQQRLLRELEKLQLDLGDDATITIEDVENLAAASSESARWALADALLARDAEAAQRLYLELRGQGERLAGLTYSMTGRLRDALAVVTRIDAGEPAGEVRKSLRMPPKAAQKFLADAQKLDRDQLRRAVEVMADLEYESRGGGATMDEDTVALRAIARIAA
jgi:DNA polymerase III subunit delta